MELEDVLNMINKKDREIKKIKKTILALWDNEKDIKIQKIIESFREDLK